MDELGILERALRMEMIMLGIFFVLSTGYAMFVLVDTAKLSPTDSRLRTGLLASITLMSGVLYVLCLRHLSIGEEMFSEAHLHVPRGLALAHAVERGFGMFGLWSGVVMMSVLVSLPLMKRYESQRVRWHKGVAALNFLLAFTLLMLGTIVFVEHRAVSDARRALSSAVIREGDAVTAPQPGVAPTAQGIHAGRQRPMIPPPPPPPNGGARQAPPPPPPPPGVPAPNPSARPQRT